MRDGASIHDAATQVITNTPDGIEFATILSENVSRLLSTVSVL